MPSLTTEVPTSIVLARLDAYAAATIFASRVLLDSPDGLLLTQLSSRGVLDEWPLQGPDDLAGLAALEASMSGSAESLQDLYDDHQRLFLGPERVLACPYESVYLNEEHLTFGSQTLAVRGWYHRYGLRSPAEGREPDDHIGLELGFVSHLCLRAIDAGERGTDDEVDAACAAVGDFLTEHLLRWGDECLDHVLAHAETQFYKGVGLLTRGTLRGLEADFTG